MDNIVVTNRCIHCGYESHVEVQKDKYDLWKAGGLIQRIWPDSSPSWREMLKTGIHSECWDNMFKED